jgi:hypothetical protein
MKTFFTVLIMAMILLSCTNPTGTDDRLIFKTDKTTYSHMDSVKIELGNGINDEILVGLRCGIYLEMFYQKKVNSVWTDNLIFAYMSLKCASIPDTVKVNSVYRYTMSPTEFDSMGEYRLVLNYNYVRKNLAEEIYSNSFEIKN